MIPQEAVRSLDSSHTMKWFVLLKPKLIQLDNILPLIFELKEAGLNMKLRFVAPNRETYALIRKNPVLYDAIGSLGGTLSRLSSNSNRILRLLTNLVVLKAYLFHKVISVETAVDYSPLTTLLARFNRRVWKGSRILTQLTNQPARQLKAVSESISAIVTRKAGRQVRGYDFVFLSHSPETHEEANRIVFDPGCSILQVGYTRGLKRWQEYLREYPASLSKDDSGEYIFFLVPGLGVGVPGEDSAPSEEIFEESLSVLKAFNGEIRTIFRPHPVTDLQKMEKILVRSAYGNYQVSFLHPMVLMGKAKFVMSNGPSTLLSDAYFMGRPTVEYSHYDSRYLGITGGRSLVYDHADFFINRDPARLREVVENLLKGRAEIRREPGVLSRDFPTMGTDEVKEKLGFLGV